MPKGALLAEKPARTRTVDGDGETKEGRAKRGWGRRTMLARQRPLARVLLLPLFRS